VGYALLAIKGANASAAGPHMQFTTASDDYPLLQIWPWTHDNVGLLFDCYYDGATKSSDAGSNFMIQKQSDLLKFRAESSIAQGSGVTFLTAMQIEADGEIMHAPGSALKTYWRDAAISVSSQTDGHLDLEADVSIDLNAYTEITGLDAVTNMIAKFYGDGAGYARIAVDTATGEDAQISFMDAGATKWTIGNEGGVDALHFNVGTGAFSTTSAMVITTAGGVGLGTIVPDNRLHLANAAATGSNNILLKLQNTTTAADVRVGMLFSTNAGVAAATDGAFIQAHNDGVTGAGHLSFGSVLNLGFTENVRFLRTGEVGIGTTTVPHGGVGVAKLAIDGDAGTFANGAYIQLTNNNDDYPLLGFYPYLHDNIHMLWDCYLDSGGVGRSSDAGSNFNIRKNSDVLAFQAEAGIAAGNAVTLVTAFQIEADAEVMFSPGAARKFYYRDADIWIASLNDSYLDIEANTAVRIGCDLWVLDS
ncbi:unnamed protein product, partial [marine sediment metagenome]